jgi:hypothetical protein
MSSVWEHLRDPSRQSSGLVGLAETYISTDSGVNLRGKYRSVAGFEDGIDRGDDGDSLGVL